MTWVRIDEGFPEHPKVLAAGGDAAWLFVAGLCYCNRNLTDGFIPRAALARLCAKRGPELVAERLVSVRLWEATEDGWLVHDFDQYQPNRAEVLAAREHVHSTKAEAGRLGGLASGVARRKHTRSKGEAESKQEGSTHEARPDPTRPVLSYISDDDDSVASGNGQSSVTNEIIELTAKALARADRANPTERFIAGIARNVRSERLHEIHACLNQGMSVHEAAVKLSGSLVYVELAEMETPA